MSDKAKWNVTGVVMIVIPSVIFLLTSNISLLVLLKFAGIVFLICIVLAGIAILTKVNEL